MPPKSVKKRQKKRRSRPSDANVLKAFPKKRINRLIRSALPRRVRITDEFKIAVNRCVHVWIWSLAKEARKRFGKTRISADMIIGAAEAMGFPEMVGPLRQLQQELDRKREEVKRRKQSSGVTNTDHQSNEDPNTEHKSNDRSQDLGSNEDLNDKSNAESSEKCDHLASVPVVSDCEPTRDQS